MRATFNSSDRFVIDKLNQFIKDGNVRMKLVGNNTWIITTQVDKEGVAQYDNDPYILQDKLRRRNKQIKDLSAKLAEIYNHYGTDHFE